MKRLTERVGDYIRIKGNIGLHPTQDGLRSYLDDALLRLAEYEETGMYPEGIVDLISQHNPMLTMEKLLEMDGEPVWLQDGTCYVVNVKKGYCVDMWRGFMMLDDIHRKGAYRLKPEKEETE